MAHVLKIFNPAGVTNADFYETGDLQVEKFTSKKIVSSSEVQGGDFDGEPTKIRMFGSFDTSRSTGVITRMEQDVNGKTHFQLTFDTPVPLVENPPIDPNRDWVFHDNDYDNVFRLGDLNDRAYGKGGGDTLRGLSGDDTIIGGQGSDSLSGGGGDDKLKGGADDDEAYGKGGGDTLRGLSGDDTIIGGQGSDSLSGGGGDDKLKGGADDDEAFGSEGGDTLEGNGGNDSLKGGDGNDTILGGDGEDTLIGDGNGTSGRDILDGGRGKDELFGGAQSDTLTGGGHADTFLYKQVSDSEAGNTRDIITDFDLERDLIDLSQIDADTTQNGNQSFNFIGNADFSGQAGELRTSGSRVAADVDGDGKADFQIDAAGAGSMTEDHFIL